MEFQKEQEELMKIVAELKNAVNLPVDVPPGDRKTPLTIEELEVMLGRTQEIMDKLNNQANEIAGRLGMSREEMTKYVEKPENLGKEETKIVEQIQSQLDAFQKTLVQSLVSQENEEIVKKMTEQQKKQKLAGRRNWLPM